MSTPYQWFSHDVCLVFSFFFRVSMFTNSTRGVLRSTQTWFFSDKILVLSYFSNNLSNLTMLVIFPILFLEKC